MHLQSVLLFLSCTIPFARADFLVLTNHPEVVSATLTGAKASTFVSRVAVWAEGQVTPFNVAQSQIEEFAQTATFSIPPVVTEIAQDDTDATIFTTVPDWYSALPTEARKFKDDEASAFVSAFEAANGAKGVTAGLGVSTTIAIIAATTLSLVVVLL
ncbi:hypothetical protein K491DRAFT_712139 [Lophiostoma macrostomum CBS 122681]|uniref:Uncharacterized protein n=1 Tax=Lophiostoma macrostomum CBS 122681 TaxID=1314788 RepID=A0A6A6TMF0_9PLEO|nr:hypothetical protein K491DRAFT_712139 [Lophiostoma macrostomum CBS 122681]